MLPAFMKVRVMSVGLLLGTLCALLAWAEPGQIAFLFPDDAFFYLKTAQHVADGQGSTFDGINPSNGYHPLYMLLLAAVARLSELRGVGGLYTVLCVDGALMVAWLWVMVAVARAFAFSETLAAVLGAALLPIAFNTDFGTEAKLLQPLVWSFVLALRRVDAERRGLWVAAALGAVSCLARLDAILFVSIASAVPVLRELRRHGVAAALRTGAILVGPSLLVLGSFAAFNQAVYGHPTTISSWLKFGPRDVERAAGRSLFAFHPSYALALCVACGLAVATLLRALARRFEGELLPAALASWLLLYLGIMVARLRGGMEYWYFTLPFSVAALLGLELLRASFVRWSERLQRVALAGVIAASLTATALQLRHRLALGWYLATGEALGEWVDHNLPPDARLFQVDNAGLVAYFSNRALVNGDGLINGWEFQEYLRRGALPEYLIRHRVRYFVWDQYDGRPGREVRIDVPLWDAPPVYLGFATEPRLVVRFRRFALFEASPQSTTVTGP